MVSHPTENRRLKQPELTIWSDHKTKSFRIAATMQNNALSCKWTKTRHKIKIRKTESLEFSLFFGSKVGKVFFFFFPLIFICWKLITLQYCSDFCHTLTWISHGFTCVPHPDPPSRLPPHPIPLGLPSAPALSTCLMHPTWTGDLFHP